MYVCMYVCMALNYLLTYLAYLEKVIPYVNGLALACKTYIVDSDPPVIMVADLVSTYILYVCMYACMHVYVYTCCNEGISLF